VSAPAQAGALSWRAMVGIIRQPQVLVPSLFFPLFFAALNTAAFQRTTSLPGFPAADSFLDFIFPATVVQGVLFGGIGAASELAQDIENGFFERLIAAPIARTSILVGRLAGGASLGFAQALIFMGIFTAFGAEVQAGIPGILVMAIAGTLLALFVGGFGSTMALRTGSVEAVQGSFPLFFVTVFFSSAFFPRELMSGWFKSVATYNPISWMIEAMRDLVLVGWSADDAITAIGVPAVGAALTITMSLAALRYRLAAAA
jgi:ABC-2 type transport system permease protein